MTHACMQLALALQLARELLPGLARRPLAYDPAFSEVGMRTSVSSVNLLHLCDFPMRLECPDTVLCPSMSCVCIRSMQQHIINTESS